MYCRCQNLNCRTVEYKYIEKTLVASKYCQTVNCRTIEVLDCEIRLYVYSLYKIIQKQNIGLCTNEKKIVTLFGTHGINLNILN